MSEPNIACVHCGLSVGHKPSCVSLICALCGKKKDAHAPWCAEVKERMEEKQGECPMCGCTNGEHRGHCMNFKVEDVTPKAVDEIAKKPEIANTLAERNSRYGSLLGHGTVTQQLKDVMRNHPRWSRLTYDKKEALDMIQHKIGRILNGDSNFHDSWHDIEGYARLISETLKP